MNNIKRIERLKDLLRQSFIITAVMLLVGIFPAPVFADPADPTSDSNQSTSSTNPTPPPSNGVNVPTGSSAHTFWFNHDTGLWENDYYTWNPNTHVTLPKVAPEYTYNHSTGLWDTQIWQYSAARGAYYQAPVAVTAPPAGAVTHGGPVVQEPVASDPASNGGSGSEHGSEQPDSSSHPESSISSGGSSDNGSAYDSSHGTGTDLTFSNGGSITNLLDSTTRTGDALIIANTNAGNATSGDATSIANILNLLQSQSSLSGQDLAMFTANIQGNVQGDFLIDPAAFTQPANISQEELTKLKVNAENNGNIENNVNLDAVTGNATIDKNTNAGNATTGDANAVANVINMINSVVAANQSFLGVVNIHGDYTGNILVPTDSLNALLASTGPDSNNTVAQTADASMKLDATSNTNVANNTDLNAQSGNAVSTENTHAGNATTGDALTNLTILNLTGRQVMAANSLLVFVNVLGSWVGLIMDAPVGTTAAAYGGGVTANKAIATEAEAAIKENYNIENNITANAQSGDANVTRNTNAGSATTGDATASANIANLTNSQLNLSNWFGVLFINVFGTWRGNFGVAKPSVVPPITSGSATANGGQGGGASPIKDMRVFEFTPSAGGSEDLELSPLSKANQDAGTTSHDVMENVSTVLSSSVDGVGGAGQVASTADSDPTRQISIIPIILGLMGLTWVGIDRVRTNTRKVYSTKK